MALMTSPEWDGCGLAMYQWGCVGVVRLCDGCGSADVIGSSDVIER